MSYTQRYHASIEYSGSVTVNFPASESGGSKTEYYSGSVPVDVAINVNTAPFDGSINTFKHSVDGLGGAVVAMNAAQCAAIQKTADEVSASLTNGFFNTINTELSQQIQALDSAIKAVFGLITEQGKAVTDKKTQMEGDYNRISSRYIKLFDDLDSECHKRIYALDKPAFSLSEKAQQQLITETIHNTVALNLLGIEEVSSSKTMMFVSSIKRRVLDVLKTLHNYITQESTLNLQVNSLLSDEAIDKNIPLAIPVIWTESNMLESGSDKHESFIPGYIDEQRRQLIAQETDAVCLNSMVSAWTEYDQTDKEALDTQFKALAESSFVNSQDETEQRVYQTMLSLWQNSNMYTLKGASND